jgi:signal transduction histidine kinase
MRSMRQRAEMLAGSSRVDSRPGTGIKVELGAPARQRP